MTSGATASPAPAGSSRNPNPFANTGSAGRDFAYGSFIFSGIGSGVQIPAALVEPDQPLPPAAAAAKQQVADAFTQEVDQAEPPANQPKTPAGQDDGGISEKKWSDAQAKADAHLRALLGDAAYNELSMKAAHEALGK